jgi:hypothetical protein
MKKGLLILLLFSAVFAQGQSLKETLYGGKLKAAPGTVIRKGDDLSKLDTVAAKGAPADTTIAKLPLLSAGDSVGKITAIPAADSVTLVATAVDTTVVSPVTAPPPAVDAPVAAPPKENNALWKDYMATVISSVNTEVLPSKKIKKGTYYAMVSYVIGTDGVVTVGEVTLTPENATLKQGISDRLTDAPRLNPVLSSGTPRKVTKKYSFTITKE